MKSARLLVVCLLLGVSALAVAREDKKEPDLMARLKKVKGSFSLIVSFQVKKGEEKAFVESAAPCITASRKEPGCKRYELHQDLEDPTKFTFVERWASVKALEEHLAADYVKKLLGTLEKAAAGPPRISIAKRTM